MHSSHDSWSNSTRAARGRFAHDKSSSATGASLSISSDSSEPLSSPSSFASLLSDDASTSASDTTIGLSFFDAVGGSSSDEVNVGDRLRLPLPLIDEARRCEAGGGVADSNVPFSFLTTRAGEISTTTGVLLAFACSA